MSSASSHQPIENYGVIGDLRSLALVGMNGAIDFLCWPRFDSPTLFAALLDQEKGGRFQLHPLLNGARHKQLYFPDTNVLLTHFLEPEVLPEYPTSCGSGPAAHQASASSGAPRRCKAK